MSRNVKLLLRSRRNAARNGQIAVASFWWRAESVGRLSHTHTHACAPQRECETADCQSESLKFESSQRRTQTFNCHFAVTQRVITLSSRSPCAPFALSRPLSGATGVSLSFSFCVSARFLSLRPPLQFSFFLLCQSHL